MQYSPDRSEMMNCHFVPNKCLRSDLNSSIVDCINVSGYFRTKIIHFFAKIT